MSARSKRRRSLTVSRAALKAERRFARELPKLVELAVARRRQAARRRRQVLAGAGLALIAAAITLALWGTA